MEYFGFIDVLSTDSRSTIGITFNHLQSAKYPNENCLFKVIYEKIRPKLLNNSWRVIREKIWKYLADSVMIILPQNYNG